MFNKVAAVFAAALMGVLLTGGTAWAQASGRQAFTLVGVNAPATVIATGVITARGVEEEISFELDPETGAFTAVTSFKFARGTVFLTIEGTSSFTLNERSCVVRVNQSGTYEITGGSGDFEGATGDGTANSGIRIIAGRNADLSCSQDPADEVFRLFVANLRGDIARGGAQAAA